MGNAWYSIVKESPIDAQRCPLCGYNNQCGMAAGETNCWCFSQPIVQSLLERLPVEARGVTCVCRTCAMSHNARARALEHMAEVLRRR